MKSVDKVLLVVGSWVNNSEKRWVFEPDYSFIGEHYISLYSGMDMSELVKVVREEIDPTYEGVELRLSYQYPEWISADGGGLEMPQYITDDTEVGAFIELRRSIEPVNLLVSLIIDKPHEEEDVSYINDIMDGRHGDGKYGVIEADDWHEFAMAGTAVTTPDTMCDAGEKNLKVDDTIPLVMSGVVDRRRCAVPFLVCGVEIREEGHNVQQRIRAEPRVAIEKGKKKLRIETISDTDSDSDDDMVVPNFKTIADISGKGKRPMWERLIFGSAGIPNPYEEYHDLTRASLSSQSNPTPEGIDMVNNPQLPPLIDREEPPQRTVHQISGGENEISDVNIEENEIFIGGRLNSNINENTSADTTVFVKNWRTASSIRRCIRCGIYGHNKSACRIPM